MEKTSSNATSDAINSSTQGLRLNLSELPNAAALAKLFKGGMFSNKKHSEKYQFNYFVWFPKGTIQRVVVKNTKKYVDASSAGQESESPKTAVIKESTHELSMYEKIFIFNGRIANEMTINFLFETQSIPEVELELLKKPVSCLMRRMKMLLRQKAIVYHVI